jgi:hypothetical protein
VRCHKSETKKAGQQAVFFHKRSLTDKKNFENGIADQFFLLKLALKLSNYLQFYLPVFR